MFTLRVLIGLPTASAFRTPILRHLGFNWGTHLRSQRHGSTCGVALASTSSHSQKELDDHRVKSRRVRKGPKAPLYTPEEDAYILTMREQRKPWKAIGPGLPHRTVHGLQQRFFYLVRQRRVEPSPSSKSSPWAVGPVQRGGHYSIEEDAQVRRLRADGLNTTAIAQQIGRPVKSLNARWYEYLQRTEDVIGKAQPAQHARSTALEQMTAVYLHEYEKWTTRRIAQEALSPIPHNTVDYAYYNCWKPRWRDLVTSDPRKWTDGELKAVAAQRKFYVPLKREASPVVSRPPQDSG